MASVMFTKISEFCFRSCDDDDWKCHMNIFSKCKIPKFTLGMSDYSDHSFIVWKSIEISLCSGWQSTRNEWKFHSRKSGMSLDDEEWSLSFLLQNFTLLLLESCPSPILSKYKRVKFDQRIYYSDHSLLSSENPLFPEWHFHSLRGNFHF